MEAHPLRILVVDDEPPIVDLVRGYLEREQMEVIVATDGPTAVEVARTAKPDVIVLDIMLPGFDGIEVCRRIRAFSDAFVLMLTARAEEIDKLVGLAVGADDYLTKPFSPRELVARVKALVRRARRESVAGPAAPDQAALPIPSGLYIDVRRREVTVDGSPVELTPTEFSILALLARDPGVVVARSETVDAVWGPAFAGDDRLVDVHLANLRRKLGDDADSPRFIDTVRGVGYRLVTRR
jgi:DNA-binding response OmpR family regulator